MFSYDALYIDTGSLYPDGTDMSCLGCRFNGLAGIAFGSYVCQIVGCRLPSFRILRYQVPEKSLPY